MAASLPGRGRRVKRALVHRSEEPDQAPEKALRLSERELEDHANRQCDLDRNPTPATTECYDSSFGWGSPSVIERSGHCLTDGRGDASEPLPPPSEIGIGGSRDSPATPLSRVQAALAKIRMGRLGRLVQTISGGAELRKAVLDSLSVSA